MHAIFFEAQRQGWSPDRCTEALGLADALIALRDYHDPPEYMQSNDRLVSSDPLAMFDEFILSDEEVDALGNEKWLYKNMIISGHVVVFCAPPNGGKTAILFHIALELAEQQ